MKKLIILLLFIFIGCQEITEPETIANIQGRWVGENDIILTLTQANTEIIGTAEINNIEYKVYGAAEPNSKVFFHIESKVDTIRHKLIFAGNFVHDETPNSKLQGTIREYTSWHWKNPNVSEVKAISFIRFR